ncbi:MAG: tetratricopeptide repeat protein [Rickettsiales bacterium]
MNETGNNEDSAFKAALALHRQGQFAAAGEAYRAILADDPAHGAARLNLGHALRRLGRDEEAEAAFQAATELPDSAAGAWYNLGNLLASRRDFGPASPSNSSRIWRRRTISSAACSATGA